jgi:hypothetical protein
MSVSAAAHCIQRSLERAFRFKFIAVTAAGATDIDIIVNSRLLINQ